MPLGEELSQAIEQGKVAPRDEFKARARVLADEYGWEVDEAKKIWAFGPETTGPNLFVDVTKGVQYLNEIKDSCVAAFQWATKEGVCAEENMRGIRFNLLDVTVSRASYEVQCRLLIAFADARGRCPPWWRSTHPNMPSCLLRSLLACYPCAARAGLSWYTLLVAVQKPYLTDPTVEIQCPENAIGGIYSVLNKRRGQVFSEEQRPGTPMFTIKAYLPVMESFGFTADLQQGTQGQAFPQSVFDHWELMPGSCLDKGSKVEGLVKSIRTRKGLKVSRCSVDRHPYGTYTYFNSPIFRLWKLTTTRYAQRCCGFTGLVLTIHAVVNEFVTLAVVVSWLIGPEIVSPLCHDTSTPVSRSGVRRDRNLEGAHSASVQSSG